MDFLNDNNSNDGDGFKINEVYANRYDKWRKSEELQKLKDKYGDNYEENSSTSEEEDEDAVELTEDVEKDFFKTLSCLKEKNPKIYDDSVQFFQKNTLNTERKKEKPAETLTMAAYQRKLLLETNGVIEEDAPPRMEDLPLVEQEKALKESFKAALHDTDSEDEGVGGLFKTRERSKEEVEKEDADYRHWLSGQDASVPKDDAKQMKGLRDYWTDPNLDEGEKFLRDYILNHKYLEKDNGNDETQFVSESEDETIQKEQEEFERKFNFRFEEPDQEFIKRYPRTVEQSMRKKDDRRKKHREELKARKLAEKSQKEEELKRLKALKRAEIMEKIKKLQEVTGNDDLTFQDKDVDGDFNPEEHDKRMSQLFDEEFYETNVDTEKPKFPDLDEELEIENWDEWDGKKQEEEYEEEVHCEDPGFVMDCDYDPKAATQQQLVESSRRRKKRRQSKFAEAVARPKPVFDPKDTTFEKYLDEYYALNYEDLIGDIPCRFKYRKVVPNDFGLSIEEILSAPDKELNRWVSIKKIIQRRPDHVEHYDVKAYERKARNIAKKMQCLPSIYAPPEETEEIEAKGNTSKNIQMPIRQIDSLSKTTSIPDVVQKKKRRKGSNNSIVNVANEKVGTNQIADVEQQLVPVPEEKKVKSLKRKHHDSQNNSDVSVTASLKKKIDNVENTSEGSNCQNSEGNIVHDNNVEKSKKKRKKKKKNKEDNTLTSEPLPTKIKKLRKWKHKQNSRPEIQKSDENPIASLSNARLKSYGLNPKKFKNKLKYSKK